MMRIKLECEPTHPVREKPLWVWKAILFHTCPTAGLIDMASPRGKPFPLRLPTLSYQSCPWTSWACSLCEWTLFHIRTKQALTNAKSTSLLVWTPIAHTWQGWAKRCLAASQSSAPKTSCLNRSSVPRLCFLCRKRGQQLSKGRAGMAALASRPPAGNWYL